MRRKNPSQITGRHDPAGDWREVGPTTCHLLCPQLALGRPTLRGLETKQHERGRYRRSNTPMGRWPGELLLLPLLLLLLILSDEVCL